MIFALLYFIYRDTPEEHDRELSDFVNKFPEHINPKNNYNTKKTNFKRRIKETCSSGDEEFIRDMLDIKKRTPKSKRKRQVLLEMGKPRTDSKSNALITRSANQNPVRNICASHETDNTSCPLCEKVLMCDDLVTHMLLEHREECSSRPTENLRESQTNEELYFCKHCHVECSDQSELTNHILEHHRSLFKDTKIEDKAPIKKKVLKCHVCDYTTTTHAGIHYHIRSKHGTEDDKFKCNFCSYKCYKKFDLLHHTKRNHLAIIKEIKRSIGMPMQ